MMMEYSDRFDIMKRKIRKLKQLEIKIRFGGVLKANAPLVWSKFFDLHEVSTGIAKYSINMLTAMSKEEYKNIIDEYFSYVYFELYKDNDITVIQGVYDPDILLQLGLPYNASETDIKRKFRELIKINHPDSGGDTVKFIALMENYRKLIDANNPN